MTFDSTKGMSPMVGDPAQVVAFLATLLALMPDASVVVDSGGSIISANQQALRLFQYAADDLVGQPIEILVPERYRHRHRGHRSAFDAEPHARPMGANLELFGRRRDGTEFPLDISLNPIGQVAPGYVVAAVRDATERREAAAAQSLLASIVEGSIDGILSMSHQGVVTTWNPGAERLFGYTAADAVGSHVSRLIPPESSSAFEELLDAARGRAKLQPLDTVWRTRDGRGIDVAISISSLRPGTDASGYSVLARDATDRKLAERALWNQERLHAATAEIRLALLDDAPIEESLALVTRWVSEIAGTGTAGVFVVGEADLLAVAWHRDTGLVSSGRLTSGRATSPSLVARAIESKMPQTGALSDFGMPDVQQAFGSRPVTAIPIPAQGDRTGALVVHTPDGGLDEEHLSSLGAISGQVALALELSAVRADRDRLLLSSDRERIARDLHDLVIQRLFGAGLRLEGVLGMVDSNSRAAARIASAVDDLDATIREIRTAIFALEAPQSATASFRDEVVQAVATVKERLGHEPDLSFHGSSGDEVPADLRNEVLAVLREALSNVARHAHASSTEVSLSVSDEVVLIVADNGVGIGGPARSSGLSNARERAERLGGSLDLESPASGGTRFVWRVPLPDDLSAQPTPAG